MYVCKKIFDGIVLLWFYVFIPYTNVHKSLQKKKSSVWTDLKNSFP